MNLFLLPFKSLFITFLFVCSIGFAAEEGLLNQLLAPGPLILGHEHLEVKDCLKCHDAGKGIPEDKCLSCHKEIKPFIVNKTGFHGIASKSKSCIECHTDHKGRENDTTRINEKKFDHFKLTDYDLIGKHAQIKCQECHTNLRNKKIIRPSQTRYFGSKGATCVACHKKDDIHFFTGEFAKKDCNACHGSLKWKDNIKFNHDRDTQYKLVEKHDQLKCNDCHNPTKKQNNFKYQYSDLKQKQCLTCHTDFHKNNLSNLKFNKANCTSCHTQTNWKISKFNHDITTFKLKGKHAEKQCIDCHKSKKSNELKNTTTSIQTKNLNFTGLRQQCLSCHDNYHRFDTKNQDSVKNTSLNQCQKCHNDSDWKQTHSFDHNSNTRFLIDGKHLELKCLDCHVNQKNQTSLKIGRYYWKQLEEKTCENCHKSPHLNEFSKALLSKKCTSCHTTEDWYTQKSNSAFNHDTTQFQLTGAHKKVRCSDCHGAKGKQLFKFGSKDKNFCIDCHNNIHSNEFNKNINSTTCSVCHTTEKFNSNIKFDHKTTGYLLEGEHQKVNCQECHKRSQDNYNLKWPNFSLDNQNKNRENLKLTLKLTPKPIFKFSNLKTESCSVCHKDYHAGQLKNNCSECHDESGFKNSHFVHNKQSRFKLIEKHKDVQCVKCHLPSQNTIEYKNKNVFVIKYKPLLSQCINCHKDPHKGNFGQSCQECHSEKSWKTTKDFHKKFTLSGIHYSLDCNECHKDGKKLSGMSLQCISCHLKDDIHNSTLPNCSECHTQHFWELTQFKHSISRFPLRGAHRTIDCTDCHQNGAYKGLSNTCVSCHLTDYQAHPAEHATASTNCLDCHKNTFTFRSAH